jgi:ketosteroid isomerase-like protein
MSEHANARRVRALFEAFRAHDLTTVLDVIPEDAVWHFPGRRGRLAGEHRGRDAILRFLLAVQELTGGTFRLDLADVVANDRNVVVLFRGHAEREGRTLDNPTCLRLRMEDGRVREVWEFVWDLYGVDDFWA